MKKRSVPFTEDALRQALGDYLSDYAASLPTEAECSDITFSAEFEEKMALLTRRQKRVYYYWTNTAFKKAACVLVALMLVAALITVGVGAFRSPHEYLPATCSLPMQCTHCDKTAGESLGHLWIPATCTAPMYCSRCGETSGEPLPHPYTDATCTAPRTCPACGATEGEPLPHTFETVGRAEPTCTKTGALTEECTVCGKKRTTPIDKLPHIREFQLTCQDVPRCSICGTAMGDSKGDHNYGPGGCCIYCGKAGPNYRPYNSGSSLIGGPASPFGEKGSPSADDFFPSIP